MKRVQLCSKATAKKFMRIWNASPSRDALASKMGLPPATVGRLAIRLRRSGMKVKRMNWHGIYPAKRNKSVDWDAVVKSYMAKVPKRKYTKRAKSGPLVRLLWAITGK